MATTGSFGDLGASSALLLAILLDVSVLELDAVYEVGCGHNCYLGTLIKSLKFTLLKSWCF
jgi:hypothetical protein